VIDRTGRRKGRGQQQRHYEELGTDNAGVATPHKAPCQKTRSGKSRQGRKKGADDRNKLALSKSKREDENCKWCCRAASPDYPPVTIASEWLGRVDASFCCWECAKSWNQNYSSLQLRYSRNVLIDIEAGKLVNREERPEGFRSKRFLKEKSKLCR